MGLLYAVFFACIAMASCLSKEWTTQMIVKNPENDPLLNSKLGNFQNAWKSLEMTTSNMYVLMFRTKIEDYYVKCVSARASIIDKDNKTANYTITYYHEKRKSYTNVTVTLRALKQTDYLLENVLRGRFNETIPSADPIPQGSNNYIEFNGEDCTSSSSPFMDAAALEKGRQNEDYLELEEPQLEMFGGYKRTDLDFYFVYSQPSCTVLRVGEECDLWLRHSDLQAVLEKAKNETDKEMELIKTKLQTEAKNRRNVLAPARNVTEHEMSEEAKQTESKAQALAERELEESITEVSEMTEETTTMDGNTSTSTTTEQCEEDEEDKKLKELAETKFKQAVFRNIPVACRFAFLQSCEYPMYVVYDETCNGTETEGDHRENVN